MDEVKKDFPEVWREHMAAAGRIGGKVRSLAKLRASRRNAVLAFQKRFPGRPLTPRLLEISEELQAGEDLTSSMTPDANSNPPEID